MTISMVSRKNTLAGGRSSSAPLTLARWVRIGAHCAILFLACVLLRDILSIEGLRLWPDQGVPLLTAGFALITASVAALRALFAQSVGWDENLVRDLDAPRRRRFAVFVGTWIGYAALLPYIGFLVATMLALTASIWTLERLRLWVTVPVAAIISVLIWLVFQRALYVSLPLGPIDRAFAEALHGF
ncbi:tripartite tricarboxylate transporter TctB family protein [Pseudorhodoplanes sinuspersici]|uniref:DUF1468 domain-containing protein n=1 Tax=Pseudorhodoplanes sinuspersici TaxID=1235591 RepID=A0A1W6ZKC8_9HYPH|nr:tripartite tricarboxylate transporter TctB family protein [Pseudorhodoplanes sinuspersici]ARP97782.1 hypothetical protein CAK95_00820 [Pseudorhodoplanes sinuspersici]RKE68491.1 tripartite tricarboxylate transporter TctB family protein [Pseudorhodoplanes sinuspersici]